MNDEIKDKVRSLSIDLAKIANSGQIEPNEVYNLMAKIDTCRQTLLDYAQLISLSKNQML